jgi:hypothetical protein
MLLMMLHIDLYLGLSVYRKLPERGLEKAVDHPKKVAHLIQRKYLSCRLMRSSSN